MMLGQKKITLLSLIAVVLGAVLVNELVLKDNLSDDVNRKVASFGERNEPEQIKWEQELAQTVSQDTNGSSRVAKKPTKVDRLMFEMLEGKYEAELNQGVVSRLIVQRNQTPITMDTESFLKSYGSILRSYDHYESSRLDPLHESIKLKNKSGENVGQFIIERDSSNRIVAIDVK